MFEIENDEPIKLDCNCEWCNPGEDYQITELNVVNSYGNTVRIKALSCGEDECIALAIYRKLQEQKHVMYVDTDRVMTRYEKEMNIADSMSDAMRNDY